MRRMIESAVTLLPHPDSPTTPRIDPGSISNDTSSTAATGPSSSKNSVRSFRTSSRDCTVGVSLSRPRLRRSFGFDPDAPQVVPPRVRSNSADSLLHRIQRWPHRNEVVDLIVVEQPVNRPVHLDAPSFVEGLPALDQQTVHFGIGVGDEVRGLTLTGVEHRVDVRFEVRVYPEQKGGVELMLEHPLGEQRKFYLLHVHVDPELAVLALQQRSNLSHPHRMRADLKREVERQPILIEYSVAVGVRPSGLAQQPCRGFRVVVE